MASMVLRSPQAVQMSVFVVRAFVAMRSMLTEQRDLARKLAELERTLTERPDTHEHAISDIIQQIMQLLSPPPEPETDVPARPRIGFSVQERRTAYKAGKKASGRRPIHKSAGMVERWEGAVSPAPHVRTAWQPSRYNPMNPLFHYSIIPVFRQSHTGQKG